MNVKKLDDYNFQRFETEMLEADTVNEIVRMCRQIKPAEHMTSSNEFLTAEMFIKNQLMEAYYQGREDGQYKSYSEIAAAINRYIKQDKLGGCILGWVQRHHVDAMGRTVDFMDDK